MPERSLEPDPPGSPVHRPEDGEADPTELHVIPSELIERAEQLVMLGRRGEAWDLIVAELVHQSAKL